MDKHTAKNAGYSLAIIAVILLVVGLFSRFYSYVSSTPDEPFFYSTIYPYGAYSSTLIIIGLLTLLIGVLLLWKVKKQK